MHEPLAAVTAEIEHYAILEPGDARLERFQAITQELAALLCCDAEPPPAEEAPEALAALQETLQVLMSLCAPVEPVWALMAGLRLWESGQQAPRDFFNVWNCARFAGLQSRYSGWAPEQHLKNLACSSPLQPLWRHSAPYIVRSNALRQLDRPAEAEAALLEGLHHCPGNPFLQFRLADLWLMTHQAPRARPLLAQLGGRYPYALEQLFVLPAPQQQAPPASAFEGLQGGAAALVWLVAADDVYLQRYGLRLAQHLRRVLDEGGGPEVLLHVHVVLDTSTAAPTETLQAMARLVRMNVTQRRVNLQGASDNQRKALYAAERFLVVGSLLQRYARPVLVTDIDVEPLRHPAGLLALMGEGDLGHTRFGVVREAWDLYPATALLLQPTERALAFVRELSSLLVSLLQQHPKPWFADQVALYRLIEEGACPVKLSFLPSILSDGATRGAYIKILHGSWQALGS